MNIKDVQMNVEYLIVKLDKLINKFIYIINLFFPIYYMSKKLLVSYYFIYKQFARLNQFENLQKGGSIGGKVNIKWKTFHHNGVMFPKEYEPHKIPVLYGGKELILEPEAEEYATIFVRYIDTDYYKDNKFKKNFWKDWKKILGKDHIIKDLEGCDFKLIYKYVLELREKKLTLSKADKEKIKEIKEKETEKFKTAYIDGKPQPVGNYLVEPPSIFIGRGCHPFIGKIKRRIFPEDITLNLSKDAPIPVPKLDGNHKWGDIVHEKNSVWLASWKDIITGKTKYVWLSDKSDMKAQGDLEKFEMARRLKKHIKGIRIKNNENLSSSDLSTRQLATALYFIDNFALRVGNEKGEDEADTVGVVSLRVEHIEQLDNNEIKLDFLGKDSVRYVKTVKVDELVYKNLKDFTENKSKDDDIFNKIKTSDVNDYLKTLMSGLTAKVFRTYNASNLFADELESVSKKYENYTKDDKFDLLLDGFNKANAKVALLCNHQKNISKNFSEQTNKIKNQLKDLKQKKKDAKNPSKLKDRINKLKIKLDLKQELKNLSLGTSKINYIDPRITVSFMKKHDIAIDKIFNKSLQEKFKWAFEVDENFSF
jgi:DNA topoisomerase-1